MTTPRYNADALKKIRYEGRCRNCGTRRKKLDMAHVVGKVHDPSAFLMLDSAEVGKVVLEKDAPDDPHNTENMLRLGLIKRVRYVPPDAVIPLCGPYPEGCHGKHHRGELDLLPLLNEEEELMAVRQAGGIFAALKKLAPMGGQW